MIDFELLVDEIRIEARAAILDGCILELEPSQFSDIMEYLVERLRQAEKDAARYRWLRKSASTEDHAGLTYNFRLVDAIRYMPGAAPNETMDIDDAIDEAMKCNGDNK